MWYPTYGPKPVCRKKLGPYVIFILIQTIEDFILKQVSLISAEVTSITPELTAIV